MGTGIMIDRNSWPFDARLALDGFMFELRMSRESEKRFDCTCYLNPSMSINTAPIRSISFKMEGNDIARLASLLESHIETHIAEGHADDCDFVSYDLGFQLCALAGEVVSISDGYFSIRIMLNVGMVSDEGPRAYVGCETTVDVRSILSFVSDLRNISGD